MRPQFHFTASSGWINDPHGITYRDGGYDVFFQFVPGSTVWQPGCHWGHARGADLMSLGELPVAIAPGDGDDGIWTGSLVIDDDGRARIFYTATSAPDFGIGRIRVATPVDHSWVDWCKGEVVVEAPADLDLIAYRDPFIRREGDEWRMMVGAAGRDGTAMVLSHVADDEMADWRYDGITLQRSTHETAPLWTGALWECPQIFAIEDRFAMVSSVWDADTLHYAAYCLGSYSAGRFVAENWGRLTYGPSYYAPSLFFDDQQRPCLSFWMREVADVAEGWAGAHSVPHLLGLENDLLVARPHPDVDRYRGPLADDPGRGQALDINWCPSDDDELVLLRGAVELAAISVAGDQVSVVVEGSSWRLPRSGPLRVIVDGPILELSTGAGNFGTPIATPDGELVVRTRTSSAANVWELVRQPQQLPGSGRWA